MAEKSTFIKIDRNILNWRWYQDGNTLRLFIHLLLKANISQHSFEQVTIDRGQLVTSISHLSQELNLSIKQIRTALNHLKSTNEVAITTSQKYSIITINNYDIYQRGANTKANDGQAKGKQGANEGQQSKNVRNKEYSLDSPRLFEIQKYISKNELNANAEKFFDYYQKREWKDTSGKKIRDWKALLRSWGKFEKETYANTRYEGIKNHLTREEFLAAKKQSEEDNRILQERLKKNATNS